MKKKIWLLIIGLALGAGFLINPVQAKTYPAQNYTGAANATAPVSLAGQKKAAIKTANLAYAAAVKKTNADYKAAVKIADNNYKTALKTAATANEKRAWRQTKNTALSAAQKTKNNALKQALATLKAAKQAANKLTINPPTSR